MDANTLGTAAVLAVVLMPIVSLIKKPTWSHEAKYALGLAAAFIAALGGAVVDGHVHNLTQFIPLLGTSLGTAQTLYNLYFGKTDMNDKLEQVGA